MKIEYEAEDMFLVVESIPKDEIEADTIPEELRRGISSYEVAVVKKVLTGDFTHLIQIGEEEYEIDINDFKFIKIIEKSIEVGDTIFITNSRKVFNIEKGQIYKILDIDRDITLKNKLTGEVLRVSNKFESSETFVVVDNKIDVYAFPELVPEEIKEINESIYIERYVESDKLFLHIRLGDNLRKLLQQAAVTKETKADSITTNNGTITFNRYLIKNFVKNKDKLNLLFEKTLIDTGETKIEIDCGDIIQYIRQNIENFCKDALQSIFENKEKVTIEYKMRLVR